MVGCWDGRMVCYGGWVVGWWVCWGASVVDW